MSVYYRFHIRHTAVAHLHVVFIENLVELVVSWKMFFNKVEKKFSDVCGNVFIKWRIKPYYLPFAIASISSLRWFVF